MWSFRRRTLTAAPGRADTPRDGRAAGTGAGVTTSAATALAGRPYGGPPGGAGLAARIAADPGAPLVAVVVGPGGTGKSMLLDELGAVYARAGVEVSRYPDATGGAVLVDDAHRLTDADLDRLGRIAADPGARLGLAHRPWPRPRALAALTATLGPRRIVVMVGHLDRAAVAGRIAERVGAPVPDAMADVVHEQTGGLPGLVDVVTLALCESGRFDPRSPDRFDRPDRITVSPAFAERLRHRVDALEPAVHDLLEALALGATPDGEVLGPLLGGSPALPDDRAIGDALEAAAATGLLRENGELTPVMQELLCRLTPVLRRRELQRRLAAIELDRGGSVLVAGRRLLGSGAGGERVGAVLEAAAAEALPDSPALAGELLAAAAAARRPHPAPAAPPARAGAPARGPHPPPRAGELRAAAAAAGRPDRALAARRARAAALAGDLDAALRHADQVLADPGAPGHALAVETAAAVLAHRGLLAGSAQLYRGLSPAAALLGVPALVAIGALTDALTTAAVAGAGPCAAVGRRDPSGADVPVADGADQPAAAGSTAGATASRSEHRGSPGSTADQWLGARAGAPGTTRAPGSAAPRYPHTAAGPAVDTLAGRPVDGREYPGALPGWLVGGREYIDVPDAPPVPRHPGP